MAPHANAGGTSDRTLLNEGTKRFAARLQNNGNTMNANTNINGAQREPYAVQPLANQGNRRHFATNNNQHAAGPSGFNSSDTSVANVHHGGNNRTAHNMNQKAAARIKNGLPRAHVRDESMDQENSRSGMSGFSGSFGNKTDDGADKQNIPDIRAEIAPDHKLNQTHDGKWFEASWSHSYESKQKMINISRNILTPFVTTWLENVNEDAKPTFLKEGNPTHILADVDTETGKLMEPVQYPQTMRNADVQDQGLIFRQTNWTSNLICSKEQDRMQNKLLRAGKDPNDIYYLEDADPLMPSLEEGPIDQSIVSAMLAFTQARDAQKQARIQQENARKAKAALAAEQAAAAEKAAKHKAVQDAIANLERIAREKAAAAKAAADEVAAAQAALAASVGDHSVATHDQRQSEVIGARTILPLKRSTKPFLPQLDGADDRLPQAENPQAETKLDSKLHQTARLPDFPQGSCKADGVLDLNNAANGATQAKTWVPPHLRGPKPKSVAVTQDVAASEASIKHESPIHDGAKISNNTNNVSTSQTTPWVAPHLRGPKPKPAPATQNVATSELSVKQESVAEEVAAVQVAPTKTKEQLLLRHAIKEDMVTVSEIYTIEVNTGTQAIDSEAVPKAQWEKILEKCEKRGLPFIVALDERMNVVGFGFYSVLNPGFGDGMAKSECSPLIKIFVCKHSRRQGAGTALIDRMLVLSNSPGYVSKKGYQWSEPEKDIYAPPPKRYRRVLIEYLQPSDCNAMTDDDDHSWKHNYLTQVFPFKFFGKVDTVMHGHVRHLTLWQDKMVYGLDCNRAW